MRRLVLVNTFQSIWAYSGTHRLWVEPTWVGLMPRALDDDYSVTLSVMGTGTLVAMLGKGTFEVTLTGELLA